MKIQCDVCNREEASSFCSADEAALCQGCDYRVHHANKLAANHNRFPLLHPSSKDAPRCDICQKRRAILFCREDRAILCRDCDLPIHTANKHTTEHHRFLLTGDELSAYPSPSPSPTTTTASLTSNGGCNTSVPTKVSPSQLPMNKKPNSVSDLPPSMVYSTTNCKSKVVEDESASQVGSTSSISEYLIEMLPGWQVDDLLDSSAPFGFCETDFAPPCLDVDLQSNLSFSSKDFGICVPQVPQAQPPPNNNFGAHNGFKVSNQEISLTLKRANKRIKEDVFAIPQISTPSSKRSKPF